MKGDARVIELLNGYLQIELTGHKQYLLAAAVFQRWGLEKLAEAQKAYAAEETAHAAVLLRRILWLEGVPALTDASPVAPPASAEEQLRRDLALVTRAILHLRGAVTHALAVADDGSAELFEKMLVDEEEHLDWLERQLGLFGSLGEKLYLASQL